MAELNENEINNKSGKLMESQFKNIRNNIEIDKKLL
jgi:hypothetical protein